MKNKKIDKQALKKTKLEYIEIGSAIYWIKSILSLFLPVYLFP